MPPCAFAGASGIAGRLASDMSGADHLVEQLANKHEAELEVEALGTQAKVWRPRTGLPHLEPVPRSGRGELTGTPTGRLVVEVAAHALVVDPTGCVVREQCHQHRAGRNGCLPGQQLWQPDATLHRRAATSAVMPLGADGDLPYTLAVTAQLPWQPTPTTTMPETACLNYGGDLYLYAAGFREGAEALLDVVRRTGCRQDMLVYPIVYSLRHSVELLLKQVIRAGRCLVDEPGDFPDGHRLNSLWDTCKPILKLIWSNDPAYATVESAIDRLCHLDPEGEAFRYPMGRKRQGLRAPTLAQDLHRLDLGSLVADVVEVIGLLEGADMGIDYYLEAKSDMQAEFEADMQAEYANDMCGYY